MSIFGAITNAIFGRAAAARQAGQPQAQGEIGLGAPAGGGLGAGAGGSAMPQMGQPQTPVDVDQVLTRIHRDKGSPDLNYKSSIVDLMKLLDLDPSLDNRKALAAELGYTGAKDGSAEMNIWLHRKVMEQLQQHGGQVPAGLKD